MIRRLALLLLAVFSAFGADPVYQGLSQKRKALFDRYLRTQATGQPAASPPEAFDALSLTERTTFYAISHALEKISLTGKDGRSLGVLIDRVSSVERIAGQYKGKSGDEQFRVYCHLAPNTAELLSESAEFFRDKDNTVFHKGYPVNYRTRGGTPSMQVSMARTGDSADIDIDYRSSRLPKSAVNGHLSASNSDVRAGNNPQSHNRKWNGLVIWWRELFKGGTDTEGQKSAQASPAPTPPDRPRGSAPDRIEDAVEEFLSDWLIRRKPDEAMGAVSSTLRACTNADNDVENETVDGAAAQRLFRDTLREASREIGRKSNLAAVVEAVPPWDAELQVVDHPFTRQFTLVRISDSEAEEFHCRKITAVQGSVASPGQTEYGRFFQTFFRFLLPDEVGGGLVLLWTKENGAWRIVSFDALEP